MLFLDHLYLCFFLIFYIDNRKIELKKCLAYIVQCLQIFTDTSNKHLISKNYKEHIKLNTQENKQI